MISATTCTSNLFSVSQSDQSNASSSKDVLDLIKQLREERSKDIQNKIVDELHDNGQ